MSSAAQVVDAALEALVVPSWSRIGPAVRRRTEGWVPVEEHDLRGRTVLVTGGNGGIGLELCRTLAAAGATVRFTVRTSEKGERARDQIVAATGNDDVAFDLLDLLDLDAVHAYGRSLADRYEVLDAVVHNAGAMFPERAEVDGIERTVLLHVVAPMALTHHLLPSLRRSSHPGRVVWVSSGGMYTQRLSVRHLQSPRDFRPATAYARAKRAQVVLTEQLARRLRDEVVVHVMHPGWAATPGVTESLPTFDRVMGPLLRDPAEGADTAAWLVASPVGGRDGGRLWLDRHPRRTQRLPGTTASVEQERALWATVVELAGLPTDAFAPSDEA